MADQRGMVLMLDHEPMLIDRRIVLEAQSLINDGWSVTLVTRGDAIKPAVDNERGMEIRRFVNSEDELMQGLPPKNCAESDRRKISSWINSPSNFKLEKFLRGVIGLRKFTTLLYILAWPPVAASVLRYYFPGLKKIFGRAFEPLVYALLLRPLFLMPYMRLAWRRFLQKEKPAGNDEEWRLLAYEYALKLKPDVVHAHDLVNLPMGHRLANELGCVLVYDAHELYPKQYFSDEKYRQKLIETERSLIGGADAVISINRQCVEVLESEYSIRGVVPLTNATESPPGFDPGVKKKFWHERFNLDSSVKIMVFQGGINPIRNVDPLIEALQFVPEWIHIGFVTYSKDIPYYKEMTDRLRVSHRVHYVIEIPWYEVNDWLASADVGVMPYQVTNFNAKISSPNKLYEFVVAGLPIMASSELDNVKSAIEEDGLGVMTSLSGVESYVSLITMMFDHPEGPERFRSNILRARPKYMWSNEEPKLLAVYEKFRMSSYIPKALVLKTSAVPMAGT